MGTIQAKWCRATSSRADRRQPSCSHRRLLLGYKKTDCSRGAPSRSACTHQSGESPAWGAAIRVGRKGGEDTSTRAEIHMCRQVEPSVCTRRATTMSSYPPTYRIGECVMEGRLCWDGTHGHTCDTACHPPRRRDERVQYDIRQAHASHKPQNPFHRKNMQQKSRPQTCHQRRAQLSSNPRRPLRPHPLRCSTPQKHIIPFHGRNVLYRYLAHKHATTTQAQLSSSRPRLRAPKRPPTPGFLLIP